MVIECHKSYVESIQVYRFLLYPLGTCFQVLIKKIYFFVNTKSSYLWPLTLKVLVWRKKKVSNNFVKNSMLSNHLKTFFFKTTWKKTDFWEPVLPTKRCYPPFISIATGSRCLHCVAELIVYAHFCENTPWLPLIKTHRKNFESHCFILYEAAWLEQTLFRSRSAERKRWGRRKLPLHRNYFTTLKLRTKTLREKWTQTVAFDELPRVFLS